LADAIAIANLMRCHVVAYDLIKAKNPKAKVSFAKNLTPFTTRHSWSLLEAVGADIFNVYNRVAFEVFETEKISLLRQKRSVPGIKGEIGLYIVESLLCDIYDVVEE
jgi:hypothetical protein